MSVVRFHRVFLMPRLSNLKNQRTQSTLAKNEEEYTSEPIYPEILDMSLQARKRRQRQDWYDQIKAVETVEEKIIKLNMPKYYGWKCFMLDEHFIPLYSLPFVQNCTRTHLITQDTLPDHYLPLDSAATYMAQQLKGEIQDSIKCAFQDVKRKFTISKSDSAKKQEEDLMTKSVVQQINRILINNLSPNLPHLMDSQVDIEPRHESFWFVGGFDNPRIKTASEKEYPIVEHPFQYIGRPALTVRSKLPLEPLVPYSDADNESLHVPEYHLDPRNLSYKSEFRHGANIAGFWPGDSHEFGLLSYHTRGYMQDRLSSYPPEDRIEAVHAQGIKTSFGWLVAQAAYQGFTTYNDITYPLVAQTIITNGQLWSFYSYQMNTLALYEDILKDNKLRNICYGTAQLKLFEGIDNDGKLVGFNDDVLKMLIQFYINVPAERTGVNMKPYLGETCKVIADITDDERRIWLEDRFKVLISNRPRHRLPYEIYMWERIYKIMFNTRPMDARRRPFELGISPYKRRLDEHTPKYIPKVLRPLGPKSKPKWAKTFYP